jgi:hypothetical protein
VLLLKHKKPPRQPVLPGGGNCLRKIKTASGRGLLTLDGCNLQHGKNWYKNANLLLPPYYINIKAGLRIAVRVNI